MAIDPAKEKQKKKIAIVLVLVLVLISFLLWNIHRQRRAKALRQKFEATGSLQKTPSGSEPALSAGSSAPSSEIEQYVKNLVWKRDPFVFAFGEGGKIPTLQLKVSGIIFDETRPEATYAIINQEVVRIGDTFNGIQVLDIQPDYVRLKKFNEELILYLYQGGEK